jgi:hypothetical protein
MVLPDLCVFKRSVLILSSCKTTFLAEYIVVNLRFDIKEDYVSSWKHGDWGFGHTDMRGLITARNLYLWSGFFDTVTVRKNVKLFKIKILTILINTKVNLEKLSSFTAVKLNVRLF